MVGLAEEVQVAIQAITWDFNGRGRRAILALAMDHGLIRTRGHGPGEVTFEFTLPTDTALRAALAFMRRTLGPMTRVKANNLRTGESLAFLFGEALPALESGDLGLLRPGWLRPAQALPVDRPFLLLEREGATAGWDCWRLPREAVPRDLVALLRRHTPDGTGWLALGDGRTWRISPIAPPVAPVKTIRTAHARLCPDCGWPHLGASAPCQCENRVTCKSCWLPRWPIPGRDIVTLKGEVLHVPVVAGYGHRCVHWPSVHVLPFDDLLRQKA